MDTVAKKAGFIRQVGAELGLKNLTATHQRVEAMDGPGFHLVTSRAFASLHDFIGLTRERLLPGGVWAAMKAKLTADERAAVPADVTMFHVEPLTVPGLERRALHRLAAPWRHYPTQPRRHELVHRPSKACPPLVQVLIHRLVHNPTQDHSAP